MSLSHPNPLALDDRRAPTHSVGAWAWAALAWVVSWLVLAWPWLSGRVTVPWDAKAHFLPQLQFMATSFATGDSPAWNPYVFAGHPQIADPQSLLFSPPMVLLAWFDPAPGGWAMDAAVYVTILLSGLALMAWFRDCGWHPTGAVIAALAFGFGAAMAWRIQHVGQVLSLAYVPMILLLLNRALDDVRERRMLHRLAYGIGAGVIGAALVLGRDQVALLAVYFFVAYALWRLLAANGTVTQRLLRALPPLALGAVIGLTLVAIPILLTALMADGSNRPQIDYLSAGAGSFHPGLFATLIAPDMFGSTGPMADYWGPPSFTWRDTGLFIAQNMGQLYIGIIPLMLIGYAVMRGWLFDREIAPFAIAGVVMTLYALGWFTPLFGFAHAYLPGVDLYRRPADAVFLIGLFGAITAGYAAHQLFVDDLAEISDWRWQVIAAILLAAFAAVIALAISFDRLTQARAALLVSGAIASIGLSAILAAVYLKPIRASLAAGLLIAATTLDLAISNGPGGATALPPEHYAVLEPAIETPVIKALQELTVRNETRRDRVELAGLGFHWGNVSLTHSLEHTLGYNPIRLDNYAKATGAGDLIATPQDRKFTKLFTGYNSQLAKMLGLRWVAVPASDTNGAAEKLTTGLRRMMSLPDATIFEVTGTQPRAWVSPSAVYGDFETIMATGQWPPTNYGVWIDDKTLPRSDPALPSVRRGAAKILSYRNTKVRIETETTQAGWLILNDIWHPWWRATVNGKTVPIERANILFRAVRIPAGKAVVRFTFEPIRSAIEQITMPRRPQDLNKDSHDL